MNKKEKDTITQNAQRINSLGADSIVKEVTTKMEDNVKGALIGGGIGLLIGIATRNNLIVSGILGLILGRFIFKSK
jgi:hypothetical protein